jgi:hypothetical protein
MQHALSASLLVLVLPFVAGSQEPRPQDPVQKPERDPDLLRGESTSPRDIFGRPKPTSALQAALLGCWQIMDLDLEGYSTEGRDLLGFLLFSEDFVAFELQASWDDPNRATADAYQTFISEYRLKADGTLQLKTLVGSFLDREFTSLEWEAPGYGRELRVEQLTKNQIVLHFQTGGTMTFARRLRSGTTPRTLDGRPTEASEGEPDIFGRDVKKKDEGDDGDD